MVDETVLEHRLTVLEEGVRTIREDLRDVKSDVREIRDTLKWPFRIVAGAAMTSLAGLIVGLFWTAFVK
jgi:hypothetical protein